MRPGTKTLFSLLLFSLALWLGIRWLLPLALPFLLGTALALAAEPPVGFLIRRLRLPRSLAAGIGVSMTFCGAAALVVLLCAFLIRELGILAGILPNLEDTALSGISLLQNWLLGISAHAPDGIRLLLDRNIHEFFSGGTALLNRGVGYLLGLAGNLLRHVPDSALTLGTGIISGFMISAKLPKIRVWLLRRLSRERIRPLIEGLQRLRRAVGSWLLAQLKLTGVTLGLLLAGLLLLRIPYAPLWALGICLLDAFPVLGTGTVLLPWALICLLQGDTARAIGLLGVYVVITVLRSVLEPRLVGKQLGLDPLVTLMALYAGYKLWGLGGMILAPLLAVTVIQFLPGKETK